MNNLHFNENKELICDCIEKSHYEHHVNIESDGTIVIRCWNCPSEIRLSNAYIETPTPPPIEEDLKKGTTSEMTNYWLEVGTKDIQKGNIEGAMNIYNWLREQQASKTALILHNRIAAHRRRSK